MMYIIYKQDGSIKLFQPLEYVQQGNSGVNSVFVSIENRSVEQYSANAIFELPNGDLNELAGTQGSLTIDGTTYSGYVITLTAAQTVYAGNLKMSIQLVDLNDQVLYTYVAKLVVNEGPFEINETTISQAQYMALLNALNNKQATYLPTNVRNYQTLAEMQSDFNNLAVGQVFFVIEETKFYKKTNNLEYDVVFFLIDAYTKTETNNLLDAKQTTYDVSNVRNYQTLALVQADLSNLALNQVFFVIQEGKFYRKTSVSPYYEEVMAGGGGSGYTKAEIDAFLADKLDKVSTTTPLAQAYVKSPQGLQMNVNLSSNGNPNAIARYDGTGHLSTANPSSTLHATNKYYVDGEIQKVVDLANGRCSAITLLTTLGTIADIRAFAVGKTIYDKPPYTDNGNLINRNVIDVNSADYDNADILNGAFDSDTFDLTFDLATYKYHYVFYMYNGDYYLSSYGVWYQYWLKNGDVINIPELNVYDRWYGSGGIFYVYKAEDDLTNYYTKPEVNDLKLSITFGGVSAYDNTQTYAVGAKTYQNGNLYLCIVPVESPEEFDSAKWQLITLNDYGALASNNTWTGDNTFEGVAYFKDGTGTSNVVNAILTDIWGGLAFRRLGQTSFAIGNTDIRVHSRHLLPTENNTDYSIGSSSALWKDICFSGALRDGNNADYGYTLPDSTNLTANSELIDSASAQTIGGVKTFLGDVLHIKNNESESNFWHIETDVYTRLSLARTYNNNKTYYWKLDGGNISPDIDNGGTIGATNKRISKLFVSRLMGAGSSSYGLTLPDTTSWTGNKTIATTDQVHLYRHIATIVNGTDTIKLTIINKSSTDLSTIASPYSELLKAVGGSVVSSYSGVITSVSASGVPNTLSIEYFDGQGFSTILSPQNPTVSSDVVTQLD